MVRAEIIYYIYINEPYPTKKIASALLQIERKCDLILFLLLSRLITLRRATLLLCLGLFLLSLLVYLQ
jgi:hypothetical protein